MVEGVGKALVKAVERRALAVGEGLVSGDRVEESSGQRSVDAVEEFQEDQADRISLGQQTVAAGAGQLFDKAFRAELGEVVSKGGQAVLLRAGIESGDDEGIDFAGAEGVGGRDLRKADESVHEGQLAGIVELEARNAFADRGDGGLGEPLELTAIDKRLEDILLDIQVTVVDRRELVAQRGKMLDSLIHSVVGHVVAGCFGPEDQVVAHVLLDKAIAIMAADNRVGQVHVFDLGLQFAAVLSGDLATEDDGDLVRLADGPVGVEQTFPQFVERGAAKNGVKRVNHLWPQVDRSSAVKVSASSWRRSGLAHLRKALEHCWKSTPSSRMRFSSQ